MAKRQGPKLVVKSCRFSGYRKDYTKAGDPFLTLMLEGDADPTNMEILGAPPKTEHSKSWTSDRFDEDVSAKLIHPAHDGEKAKVAFGIQGGQLKNVGGDHQSDTVRLTLTVFVGVSLFVEWEDQLNHAFQGTIEIVSRGQRHLFEMEEEEQPEKTGQKRVDGGED